MSIFSCLCRTLCFHRLAWAMMVLLLMMIPTLAPAQNATSRKSATSSHATIGTVDRASPPATIELPPSMKQYAEVAAKLGAFQDQWRQRQATSTTVVKFDDPSNYPVVSGNGTSEIVQDKGRPALRVAAAEQAACFVRIGPAVSGAFSIEIDCRADSVKLNDLSIIMDHLERGPGFQFGGYGNTRNILIVPNSNAGPDQPQSSTTELSAEKLIQAGKVHTVRLEVTRQSVIAAVDGKKLGSATLDPDYDFAKPRVPLFYVYGSTATVLEVRMIAQAQRFHEMSDDDKRKFVRESLGIDDATLRKYVADWCRALDDDRFAVRDAATQLLRHAAPLAVPELLQLLKDGTPEQVVRARSILIASGAYESKPAPKSSATPPTTQPAGKPANPPAGVPMPLPALMPHR